MERYICNITDQFQFMEQDYSKLSPLIISKVK